MEIIQIVTFVEVWRAKPETIWYAANSCWWTHNPKHLSKLPNGLPCDPRGSVLFMTRNGDGLGFLKVAERHSSHYGKHGLRAFMAAHHSNCIESPTSLRPWSAASWQEYNDAIDRFDAKLKTITTAAMAKLDELTERKSNMEF